MIHAFHGFLGSPRDMSFTGTDAVLHNLYDEGISPEPGPADTLVGYSMGGRIALELCQRRAFKKLILINSHPGLQSETERESRTLWEEQILARLRTESKKDFLTYWNFLDIFKHDRPLEDLTDEQYVQSAQLFEKFRLSGQQDYLPFIRRHLDRILWVIGQRDEKYCQLAKDLLEPQGIRCVYVDGGHRLFQKPEILNSILKSENIL